jgi:RNA polymerase sigma factor (sigma-70 family)
MELEDLLKAGPFLDEVSLSVKKIIFANFPGLTEEEREEIGQDVKLKLLKMASRGKKIGNLRSYIWKMVYSAALDVINERIPAVRLEDLQESARTPLEDYVDSLSPEYLFEEKELLALTEKAIDSLPCRRRTAVLLHLQGLSLEEMALYLGESMATVRHLLYRGLGDVKGQLNALSGALRPPSLPPRRVRASKPRLEWKRT